MLVKFNDLARFGSTLVAVLFLLASCAEPQEEKPKDAPPQPDLSKQQLFKVKERLFSVPSPLQTAIDIKQTGATYNNELANDPGKMSTYETTFDKALNMGVYGADLGYSLLYQQNQDGMKYLNTCRKIGEELGIAQVFDGLLKEIGGSIENQDTEALLVIIGEAFLESDSYLQKTKDQELGIIILAGGWIEALHFATSIAVESDNEVIRRRVGEQKSSLSNLVLLLRELEGNADAVAGLIKDLEELTALYNEVEIRYEFHPPTTDESKKLTVINSFSETVMTDSQLKAIHEKVLAIRKSIVG